MLWRRAASGATTALCFHQPFMYMRGVMGGGRSGETRAERGWGERYREQIGSPCAKPPPLPPLSLCPPPPQGRYVGILGGS